VLLNVSKAIAIFNGILHDLSLIHKTTL
jgi:hypothetical protein